MIDLHVHSCCSDGSYSPARLVEMALAAGLEAMALTDHNTVEGLAEFMAAAENTSLEAVPGTEFSVDYRGTELHILGLYLPRENWHLVSERLAQLHQDKEASNRALVEALRRGGYAITYPEVQAKAGGGWINRVQVAHVLIEKGYVASVPEAFATLLHRAGGYYVPPKLPDAFETIRFIKELGAVAVLAHPALDLKDPEKLREFLVLAKAQGLDAMETDYARFDLGTTAMLKALAKELGVLESGGSDYHGTAKPDISLGTGKGNLDIPYATLEKLAARKILSKK